MEEGSLTTAADIRERNRRCPARISPRMRRSACRCLLVSRAAAASTGINLYGYAYDTIGNCHWAAENTYTANSLNQYTSVAASTNLVYDADGNIVYENPNAAAWGIEDTGYFYLSYYDNSIVSAESYEFYNRENTEYTRMNYDQYDLLQPAMYNCVANSDKEMSANVFAAEEDEYLCQISYMTTVPMTNVHYEIYKDVQDNDPTSGVLLEQGDTVNKLGGYQRLDLSGEYFLKQGEKYSVVITMTMQDDDGALSYGRVYSFMAMPQAGVSLNAVVNPGESYAYTDGKWTDWSELKGGIEESLYQSAVEEYGSEEEFLKRIPLGKDFVKVDNLPIKAYLVPASAKSGIVRGDADGDGKVTITDATMIQKYIAEYEMPENFQPEACNIDGDDRITISDVTEIQRYLAGFDNIYHIGEIIFYDEYELPLIPN